jgi:hypothetical protein
MARLHTTLLTMASLAGLALGGCALDGDGEEPEPESIDDDRPLSGPAEPQQPAEDQAPGQPDEGGQSHDPDECDGDCTSTLTEFGLVCTTCDGDAPPECLVAACSVIDRCMHCTDPKGRVGVDCSIDYEVLPIASWSVGGGDNFNVCNVAWGFPGGASGNCHYAGTESCSIAEGDDETCVQCTYQDGSGSGLCAAPESIPDTMAGRPSGLPEPGACITETAEDGVECSTCTRDDLSATKACRFAPAPSCESLRDDDPQKCLACTLEDGSTATVCDGAGT